MSRLAIYDEKRGEKPLSVHTDHADIARELDKVGVRFEEWEASKPVVPGASQDEVIAAYKGDIDRLMRDEGYQAVDVISLKPDNPDRAAFRQKFRGAPSDTLRCAGYNRDPSSLYHAVLALLPLDPTTVWGSQFSSPCASDAKQWKYKYMVLYSRKVSDLPLVCQFRPWQTPRFGSNGRLRWNRRLRGPSFICCSRGEQSPPSLSVY